MDIDRLMELINIDWVRFALIAGGGLIGGLFISNIIASLGKRTQKKMIRESTARLRSLVFVVCFVLGLRFGMESFDLAPDTEQILAKIFTVVIYVLVTWAVTRVYDTIHEQVLRPWGQRKDNISVIDVLRTFMIALIWLLGVLSALSSAGYSVSAVLAGLGIGGLALALAAQDAVANIFGGIIILTQSPFKVGDKITIGGNTGWVLNIGLRATIIQNWYGHVITVPNKSFTDSHVVNVDARPIYWEGIQLKLRHDSTIDQIEKSIELVRGVLDNADDLGSTTWVGVCNVGDGYVEVEVWYGIEKFAGEEDTYPDEYAKILGVKSKIHIAILSSLEEASIHLAVPVQQHIVSQTTTPPPQSRF